MTKNDSDVLMIRIKKDLKKNLKVWCATNGGNMSKIVNGLIEMFLEIPALPRKDKSDGTPQMPTP